MTPGSRTRRGRTPRLGWLLLGLLLATGAGAEPQFLGKQYARCSSCHFSATGGGLLTPYGRSLSRLELSTWGGGQSERDESARQEEEFLYGVLHGKLGGLSLGADLRPAHIDIQSDFFEEKRDFWMRADFQAAYQKGPWTVYGEIGRLVEDEEKKAISREHWLGYTSEGGTGVRIGRFMPAFGVRFADHTTFNRRDLGFDQDEQIYGFELSDAGEKVQFQFAAGPGTAESLIEDNQAFFISTARLQWDLSNRQSLVFSGMYRGSRGEIESSYVGSVAWGFAPVPRLTLWTELDETVSRGWDGTPGYTISHETSFEVARGLWLKFRPQLRTEVGDVSTGFNRLGFAVQWLPRTHWDLNVAWYRDYDRTSDFVLDSLVAQIHLYL